MTVVLLLGCFQMLVLATMCAYLGRLFVEAKRRPLFVIDRVLRGTELAAQADAAQDRTGGRGCDQTAQRHLEPAVSEAP